jgi:hypothetical protein
MFQTLNISPKYEAQAPREPEKSGPLHLYFSAKKTTLHRLKKETQLHFTPNNTTF